MQRKQIPKLIEQSLLRPDATYEDIKKLCEDAVKYGFYGVCVNPYYIKHAKEFLKESPVKVVSVIGFPLGMTLTEVKVYEAIEAGLLGADELDIVINIGAAKSGMWDIVRRDLSDVIAATKGLVHKVIIETYYLNEEEKEKAVETAIRAGADFIKTSTGFSPGGATAADIKLIKEITGDKAGIKASGGIKTLRDVISMVEAGATRIGTSRGVEIVKEINE